MNQRLWLLLIVTAFFVIGCKTIKMPTQRFYQYAIEDNRKFLSGDTLFIELYNPLKAPIYYNVSTSHPGLEAAVQSWERIELAPGADTMLYALLDTIFPDLLRKVYWGSGFSGNGTLGELPDMSFPFPEWKKYRVIQGYNGKFSHQSITSKYAIDFNMPIGDTICAAKEGWVVGVVEGYQQGGNDRILKDFANYITLYHPQNECYTQYVHIQHLGALVKSGDQVLKGAPIALSGNVGFSTGPHLHFNVLKVIDGVWQSVPASFYGTHGENVKKVIK